MEKTCIGAPVGTGHQPESGYSAILYGAIIENYPDDHPIPSLLLVVNQPETMHVVLAYDAASDQCHIITAYRPDLAHFEVDLITWRLS